MLRTLLFRLFATALAACLFAGGAANAKHPGLASRSSSAMRNTPIRWRPPPMTQDFIAETLRGAGFDVTGAANLDQESLRRAFQDFLGTAQRRRGRTPLFSSISQAAACNMRATIISRP